MKARMFEVKINLGNEAMQTPDDVCAALRLIIKELLRTTSMEFDGEYGTIMDINGNSVGKWIVR